MINYGNKYSCDKKVIVVENLELTNDVLEFRRLAEILDYEQENKCDIEVVYMDNDRIRYNYSRSDWWSPFFVDKSDIKPWK